MQERTLKLKYKGYEAYEHRQTAQTFTDNVKEPEIHLN